MKAKLILLFLLIFVNSGWGFFNEIQVDPEITGCGNAGVADAHNTFSAYLNPASISFNKSIMMGASYNHNPSIPGYSITSVAIKYFQPVPLGFIYIDEGIENIVSQKRFILSAGKLLFSSLSIGINIKMFRIDPSGFQENDNDPLVKSFNAYQYDAGVIFQIMPHLRGGIKIGDISSLDYEAKNRKKYNIGLNGDLNGFLLNLDLKIMSSYYNNNEDIQFFIGIKKMITDYINFSAGLDRLNFCYGAGLMLRNIGFISSFSLNYGYKFLFGSNHSIGVRSEF